MTKYLDPVNDLCFKKIFGDSSRLRNLLNSIMRLPEHLKIEEIEYIPTEQVPDLGQLKHSIVDIRCKDASGNIYIVEMQNGYADNFLKRVQLYGSKALSNQVKRGKSYADIAPVVLVLILTGHTPLNNKDLDVITFHRTVEVSTGECHLKDLSYVFVEVDRFNKTEDELESFEDQWLYFLSKWDRVQAPPKSLHDNDILSAYETVNEFNWSKEELELYDKVKLAHDTHQLNLRHNYDKGMAKGVETIAINMLKKGSDIDFISEITGLSKEQIYKLRYKS